MPSCGGYAQFWEANPRKWAHCRKAAANLMLSEGWHPKARKFDEVLHKRAYKLWIL